MLFQSREVKNKKMDFLIMKANKFSQYNFEGTSCDFWFIAITITNDDCSSDLCYLLYFTKSLSIINFNFNFKIQIFLKNALYLISYYKLKRHRIIS